MNDEIIDYDSGAIIYGHQRLLLEPGKYYLIKDKPFKFLGRVVSSAEPANNGAFVFENDNGEKWYRFSYHLPYEFTTICQPM